MTVNIPDDLRSAVHLDEPVPGGTAWIRKYQDGKASEPTPPFITVAILANTSIAR
jgi:hypothetical protein